MKITEISIRHLKMKLKEPFTTSFGTFEDKDFLVLEAKDEAGTIGWGESVAFHSPWYNEETLQTNWHMLEDFLIPLILNKELQHPDEVNELFKAIRKIIWRNQRLKVLFGIFTHNRRINRWRPHLVAKG